MSMLRKPLLRGLVDPHSCSQVFQGALSLEDTGAHDVLCNSEVSEAFN